jgi:hypothetical protein
MYGKKVYNARELEKAKLTAVESHDDLYVPSQVEKVFLISPARMIFK